MDKFLVLNQDLVIALISHLHVNHFISLCCCNKSLYRLMNDDNIWSYFCKDNTDGYHWFVQKHYVPKVSNHELFKFFFIIFDFITYPYRANFEFISNTNSPIKDIISIEYRCCGVRSVINKIDLLPNLRYINLSHGDISEIPIELSNLCELIHLDLSGNKINKIPIEFVKLLKLKCLNLAINQIETIPYELESLTSLEKLYLNNNLIEEVPVNITKLTNLTVLHLYSNRIDQISQDFA